VVALALALLVISGLLAAWLRRTPALVPRPALTLAGFLQAAGLG
jgi:hypothetical protein